MKISIITVNLNNSKGLKDTMQSVLDQSIKDFEYIVIDGGSNDGSVDCIKHYEHKLAYWCSEPDSGIYNAMNKGIRQSTAEYLLFLNSGDILADPEVLESVIPSLDKELVYGAIGYAPHMIDQVFLPPDKLTKNFFLRNSLSHPATFIHRSLFSTIGYYDESYKICADWLFFMKAICNHNVSYKRINQLISIFNTEGISSDPKHRSILIEERERALRSDFQFSYDDIVALEKEYQVLKYDLEMLHIKMNALKRTKPYKIMKFFRHPKYR